jgi:biotin operon repressor
MRAKTKTMLDKVKDLLEDKQYARAKVLSKACRVGVGTICRIIRILRESGVGIHVAKKGYTLSEFAQKTDDVYFLRRLMGRRSSDFVAVRAAQSHINKRWSTLPEKRELATIVGPLTGSARAIASGMNILLTKSEKLGI